MMRIEVLKKNEGSPCHIGHLPPTPGKPYTWREDWKQVGLTKPDTGAGGAGGVAGAAPSAYTSSAPGSTGESGSAGESGASAASQRFL